ncbi:hypothetical protein ACHAWF_004187 [Thalassiosira exigua]
MIVTLLFLASFLISAAQGFVVPAEMNVAVERIVNTLPRVGENDALELATKIALVPYVICAPFFATQSMSAKEGPVPEVGEIDFDAPLERQLKVDHIVRRQPFTLGLGDVGTILLPSFLQQAFHLYKPESEFDLPDIDEQYFTLIHDECYLGKDLTAHDCVDFDPMHKSA